MESVNKKVFFFEQHKNIWRIESQPANLLFEWRPINFKSLKFKWEWKLLQHCSFGRGDSDTLTQNVSLEHFFVSLANDNKNWFELFQGKKRIFQFFFDTGSKNSKSASKCVLSGKYIINKLTYFFMSMRKTLRWHCSNTNEYIFLAGLDHHFYVTSL